MIREAPERVPDTAVSESEDRALLGDHSSGRERVKTHCGARGPRRSRAVYLRHALTHPYNLPLFVLALATGMLSSNGLLVSIALSLELAALTLLPGLPTFQRRVEEEIALVEQAEAARTRAILLMQMDAMHREELERLEGVVDKIRDNVRKSGASAEILVEGFLGLDRLMKTYVCLAIAHRANKEILMATNRQGLADRILSLEALETSRLVSERVRGLIARRLAIARRRAERWDKTQDELDAISHQLATVSELIHLVHEQSVNPSDPADVSDAIDHFISELEASESTLRELTAFGVAERVDADVLDKGRMRLHAVVVR